MKHEILINIKDGCPDSIESGLPKNWKLIFRDFKANEDDTLAEINEHSEEEDDKYYFQYILSTYCGEVVAPRLFVAQFMDLHKLVKEQVLVHGKNQFLGTLKALDKCLGY